MYVRLAFAVAAHLEPEILLVDEVLSVGDAAFQKKCLGKMGDVARQGRTVLLVSHNMGAVRSLCSRCLWIDHGRIARDGDGNNVITQYIESILQQGFAARTVGAASDDRLQIRRVLLKNGQGVPTTEFFPGEPLTFEIHYFAPRRFDRPYFWLGVNSQFGPLFAANMLLDGHRPEFIQGEGVIACTIKYLPLLPQLYTLGYGVRAQDGITLLTPTQELGFLVTGKMEDLGFAGAFAENLASETNPVMLPYEWHLPDGRTVSVGAIGLTEHGRGRTDS
jgi:lipopolysaccharide transport system ATP-binding protein